MDEANEAANRIMELAAEEHVASADVDPEVTIAFYEDLAERCQEMANGLREEHDIED